MLTAVVFLLILTVSILIHELAHFANAKAVGLPVRAFSIGMGPVLWRKLWRGTEWRLSLLPLGGYVDLPGLAPEQDEHGELSYPEQGFQSKSIWQKLWVLVGGVIANFLLAVLLVAVIIMANPNYRFNIGSVDVPTIQTSIIIEVIEGSTAERLGLQAGDLIVALNGQERPTPQDVQEIVGHAEELELTIERNGDTLTLQTVWPPPEYQGEEPPLFGISHGAIEVPLEPVAAVSFPQALLESTSFFVRFIPAAVNGYIRGFSAAVSGQQSEAVAGPVGIVRVVNQATQVGLLPVLFITAIINFSLAVFNLLPIPGLDGGRMLLAVIVALRGKPFKAGQEEFIHFLGFMAIMALIVLITYQEVSNLLLPG